MKERIHYLLLCLLAAATGITAFGEAGQKMHDKERLIKEAAKITEKQAASELSRNQAYKVSPEYVHLLRIEEFPGVVVVGEHVTTHSGALRGVYVGSSLGTHQEQSAAAMKLAGWETADNERRITLALTWAERVLYEFEGHFVTGMLHVFGCKGRPAYKKAEGKILKDRSVQIHFWYREVERGKCATKTFHYMEVIFNADGSYNQSKILKTFDVSNQELFRREPCSPVLPD